PAAAEDRGGIRALAAAHGAQRGLHADLRRVAVRSSALTWSVGYILLGITALALFAAPLSYAWRVTIEEGRSELLQEDAQRPAAVFRRDGADALATFIDHRLNIQI